MNEADKIRTLNDALRTGVVKHGQIMLTAGVVALGEEFANQAMQAVANYKDFDKDNDPYDEHDFGSFEIGGENLFFKIDYYDLEKQAHSTNAADPSVTHRVLTIMLADEY